MEQITLLSVAHLNQNQLNKLQAVLSRLDMQQCPDTLFEDLSEAVRDRVEILYGQGPPLYGSHSSGAVGRPIRVE